MLELIGEIEVMGEAVGKQRPRASTFGGHVRIYTPTKSKDYESRVSMAWREKVGGDPSTAPISVDILVHVPLLKSDYNSKGEPNKSGQGKLSGRILPTKKPDADNIAKSVLDGLNGVAFVDDSQIVKLNICKIYNKTAMTEVLVYAYR